MARRRYPSREDLEDMYGTTSPTPTVYEEKPKDRDPDRVDMYFSPTGGHDDPHGHVTETRSPDGDRTVHYARDEDGEVYVDDSRNG